MRGVCVRGVGDALCVMALARVSISDTEARVLRIKAMPSVAGRRKC